MNRKGPTVAAACLAVACAAGRPEAVGATIEGSSPAAIVLAPGDLPAGFAVDPAGTGSRPNARAAKEFDVPLAAFRRWGRVTGYEASFTRATRLDRRRRGAVSVTSGVSVYRDAGGAHAAYAFNVKRCRRAPFARPAPAAGVGQEALLCGAAVERGGQTAILYPLIWRRDRVFAAITAVGLPGQIGPADVLPLARRQDERIRAAT
jgi:hypothetical protein